MRNQTAYTNKTVAMFARAFHGLTFHRPCEQPAPAVRLSDTFAVLLEKTKSDLRVNDEEALAELLLDNPGLIDDAEDWAVRNGVDLQAQLF